MNTSVHRYVVLVTYCCITNHPQTQWLETQTFITSYSPEGPESGSRRRCCPPGGTSVKAGASAPGSLSAPGRPSHRGLSPGCPSILKARLVTFPRASNQGGGGCRRGERERESARALWYLLWSNNESDISVLPYFIGHTD